jgi:hypothetical protein
LRHNDVTRSLPITNQVEDKLRHGTATYILIGALFLANALIGAYPPWHFNREQTKKKNTKNRRGKVGARELVLG